MSTFSQRLNWCLQRGELTISDLAIWFDRPRSTVNTWVQGRTPKGPAGRLAETWLKTLQDWIRNKAGLPVPLELTQSRRVQYIQGLRDDAKRHIRVSPLRASA